MEEFDDENRQPRLVAQDIQQNKCLSPLSAANYLSCQPGIDSELQQLDLKSSGPVNSHNRPF